MLKLFMLSKEQERARRSIARRRPELRGISGRYYDRRRESRCRTATQIFVVQHWFEELKRLVPTN